jgi:hypothetical protein
MNVMMNAKYLADKNVVPLHVMKAYRGYRGTDPHICNPGIK